MKSMQVTKESANVTNETVSQFGGLVLTKRWKTWSQHARPVANTKKHAEPMIATPLSKRPRQKVATDLFYHSGKTYIIVVDYYWKFFEIALLKNMMTDNTMNHLTSSVTMAFQNPLSLTMYPNLQLPHFENLPKNGASHTSQVVLTTSRVMVK